MNILQYQNWACLEYAYSPWNVWIFQASHFSKVQVYNLRPDICIKTKQSDLLLLCARWCLCDLSDKHAEHNLSNSEKFLQFPLAVCLCANCSREKGFNYPTPKVWMKPLLLCLFYEGVRHEHSPILKLSILSEFKRPRMCMVRLTFVQAYVFLSITSLKGSPIPAFKVPLGQRIHTRVHL